MKKYIFLAVLLVLLVPSATPVQAAITSNLSYGSKGENVVELQEFLIDQGYLTGSATGNFYSLTLKAVKAFQRASSLPATGYVGNLTRQAINTELSLNIGAALDDQLQETGSTTTPSTTTDAMKQAQESNKLLSQQIQAQLDSQSKLDAINQSINKLNTVVTNLQPTQTPTPTPKPISVPTSLKLDYVTNGLYKCQPSIISVAILDQDGNNADFNVKDNANLYSDTGSILESTTVHGGNNLQFQYSASDFGPHSATVSYRNLSLPVTINVVNPTSKVIYDRGTQRYQNQDSGVTYPESNTECVDLLTKLNLVK